MRVLPIIFKTDMVRAILDERKTVTRRVVKFPVNRYTGKIPDANDVDVYGNTVHSEKVNFSEKPFYCFDVKPTCRPGDILYVRETWGCYEKSWFEASYFMYRADYQQGAKTYEFDGRICDLPKWHSPVAMPKAAARIWLKVTDVRVERLMDMTIDDMLKEGIDRNGIITNDGPIEYRVINGFEELWNSTIDKCELDSYGFDANPWVWVIEFERCEKPKEESNG